MSGWEYLFTAEAELRKQASIYQTTYHEGLKFKVCNRVDDVLKSVITDLMEDYEKHGISELSEIAESIKKIRNSPFYCTFVVNEEHNRLLDELQEKVKKFTGVKGCRYSEFTRDVASGINDLASCIHRVAETLQDMLAKMETVGKCKISEKHNPILKDACIEWDKKTREFFEKGLYSEGDYEPLEGRVLKNRMQLTVGSSPGHRTHFDLDKGTIEYYDTDNDVNETMKKLWEDLAGLKCEIRRERGLEGVKCDGLNENNVIKAAKVAAAATSMDFRLSNPEEWWGEDEISSVIEEIGEKYPSVAKIKELNEKIRELDARRDELYAEIDKKIEELVKLDIEGMKKIFEKYGKTKFR